MANYYPTPDRRQVDFRVLPRPANDNYAMPQRRSPQKWELTPANDNRKLYRPNIPSPERGIARVLRVAGRVAQWYSVAEKLVFYTSEIGSNHGPQNWDLSSWFAASCLDGVGNLPGMGNLYCGPIELGTDFEFRSGPTHMSGTYPYGDWRVDMFRRVNFDEWRLGTSYSLYVWPWETPPAFPVHRPTVSKLKRPDWLPSLFP